MIILCIYLLFLSCGAVVHLVSLSWFGRLISLFQTGLQRESREGGRAWGGTLSPSLTPSLPPNDGNQFSQEIRTSLTSRRLQPTDHRSRQGRHPPCSSSCSSSSLLLLLLLLPAPPPIGGVGVFGCGPALLLSCAHEARCLNVSESK